MAEFAPCGCSSIFFHRATCPLAHPELAALPEQMPQTVAVHAIAKDVPEFGGFVELDELNPAGIPSLVAYLEPEEARALARELLVKAEEAEAAHG